jgi:hypothetical protein
LRTVIPQNVSASDDPRIEFERRAGGGAVKVTAHIEDPIFIKFHLTEGKSSFRRITEPD